MAKGSYGAVALVTMMSLGWSAHADEEETPPDVLVAAPPIGPAASIAAACAAAPVQDTDNPDDPRSCGVSKLRPKLSARSPYDAFMLVDRTNSSSSDQLLAIRMGASWYLAPLVTWGTDGPAHGSLAIKTAKVKDVIPGGAPEIVLTGVHSSDTENDLYEPFGSDYQSLWVCSVGASGAPSCVEVPLGETFHPNPDDRIKRWSFRLSYTFDKVGRVVRKVKGKWPKRPRYYDSEDPSDAAQRADYENTRTLQFD